VGSCSVSAGACVSSDPCLGVSVGGSPCLRGACQLNASLASGYQCFGPASPPRDCTDYLCKATGVQSQVVVGSALRDQFLTQYASKSPSCSTIQCTVDFCDSSTSAGCVNQPLRCSVPASQPCNASIGCYEVGNQYGYTPGVCLTVTVASLIDFCGTCLGDNTECFFNSLNNAAIAGGIAGGAVAGIVVACVIAALIAAFLSKKGYDFYQAQSALNSAGLHHNPAFQTNQNQGEMPGRGE
jgi:hypothetical protein